MSGWNIYSKEELKNLDNTVMVITEMIQNNQQELTRWKKDSGMYELIECQTNALYNALSALRKAVEINFPWMIGGRKMENRNFIETVVHTALTKRELIELINKSFPDEEVGNHGQIAQLSTTTMSDGTKMQNVCFGKILKV